MANKINSAKLLPSAKSSAIVKSSNIITKKTTILSGALVKSESKDSQDINNKLIKIDKFFKSDLIISQRKAETERKEEEKQNFEEAEKKLETPKSSGLKLPKLPTPPTLGFLDRLKRFLFFTAVGWALPKILEFLPKLQGIVKIIGNVYQFAEDMFGKLFDGFMTLVKFGGDLKDKTIGFIATAKSTLGGGDYQKEFDKLEKQFNTFVDASIIAGLLAVDIGGDALKALRDARGGKPGKGGKEAPPGKPSVEPEGQAGRSAARGVAQGAERGAARAAERAAPRGLARLSGVFGGLKSVLGKVLNVAAPGLSAVLGEMDARQRFKSGDIVGGWISRISASLDAFAAGVGLASLASLGLAATGVGFVVPALLLSAAATAKTISIGLYGLLIVRDIIKWINSTKGTKIPIFSKGGRIVRKYQGGGTTRAGKPVGAPTRRTLSPVRRKPKIKIQPPKSQPGKDVGGEDKIKRLYPDTDPKIFTVKDWMSAVDAAGDPLAGSAQMYLDNLKNNRGKQPNPYKAITTTAKILKEIPLVGGIMGAAVDIAMGQKPNAAVYRSLSSGISYLVESIANQKANASVISLLRDIRGFADGGNVPESRRLKDDYSSIKTEDLLTKVLGPTIEQRVNKAIQGIQKELQKQGKKSNKVAPSPGGPDSFGGAGGTSVESIDMSGLTPEDVDALGRMIEAEAGNQSAAGKASVMNVILNRYRLARAGKGYLPRGRTKDTVTIRDLLYSPSQFSPIADGRFSRTSSIAGRRALAQAISAGGNDPEKLKRVLMEKYNLSEQDANYVVVSTAFSNPESRSSRPFNTREVTVGNHTFQESPNARLRVPGERIEANVRVSASQVQALSSGFRTGLKTGPEGRIGAGTGYHIDARFMYDVPLKDKIAMLDSMAAAHAQEGFVMEFSGIGVAGIRWNLNASPKEKEELAKRILVSHHSNRHPWQAFDYFAVKQSAKDRSDKSAEGANIMAPRISGGTYEYGVGGGYGRHLIIRDKNGREIFKVGHGDQGLPSPKEIGKIFRMEELQTPEQQSRSQGSSSSGRLTPNQAMELQSRVNNLKQGQKIEVPGIGSIELVGIGPGGIGSLFGKNRRVYRNSKGKEISQDQFNQLMLKYKLPPGSAIGSANLPQTSSGMVPQKQGGGLISPSKSRLPIPNSFASYESPGSGTLIAIQPIIIEKTIPVGRTQNSMIDFTPISVNSSNTKSLSIG